MALEGTVLNVVILFFCTVFFIVFLIAFSSLDSWGPSAEVRAKRRRRLQDPATWTSEDRLTEQRDLIKEKEAREQWERDAYDTSM